MVKIIRSKNLEINTTYEPGIQIGFGIDNNTVENPQMVLGRTIMPPGARNHCHYHVNCNVGNYTIRGRRRIFFGPPHEQQELVVEPGDFLFIAKGEIHGAVNLSDTEPVEIIFCYNGVSSIEEAKTIDVEPPYQSV